MAGKAATKTMIPELVELKKVARKLERHEEAGSQIRAQRDVLIYKACLAGASERAAADAGKVSATYAHRCKADKGNPRSGPVLDQERAQHAGGRSRGKVAGVF